MRTSPGATARRLLGHLIQGGPAHRAGLSRALGVSRTTITNLVADLTESGALLTLERADGSPSPADPDRPTLKQPVGLAPERGVLVSVVFRMTSVAVDVGTLDGRLLAASHAEFPREELGAERLERAHALLREVLQECGIPLERILRLHLAVNTQCDRISGEVLSEEAAGPWRGTNPKQIAAAWSPAEVIVENTARLSGLAEYHALGEPRPRSLVYVHLSWGVTMGQVVDGEIVPGSHGGAGELGHVSIDPMGLPCACANRGCLMLYAGLDAVTERIRATLGEEATFTDAIEAVAQGSHACATILEDTGETVGRALAMVCNVVDPDAIVLGGDLALAGPVFGDAVHTAVRRRALPLVTRRLELSLATTREDPHATGRAALAAMRPDTALVQELVDAVLEG